MSVDDIEVNSAHLDASVFEVYACRAIRQTAMVLWKTVTSQTHDHSPETDAEQDLKLLHESVGA